MTLLEEEIHKISARNLNKGDKFVAFSILGAEPLAGKYIGTREIGGGETIKRDMLNDMESVYWGVTAQGNVIIGLVKQGIDHQEQECVVEVYENHFNKNGQLAKQIIGNVEGDSSLSTYQYDNVGGYVETTQKPKQEETKGPVSDLKGFGLYTQFLKDQINLTNNPAITAVLSNGAFAGK